MEYSFNNQSFDITIEIRNDKNVLTLTQNAFTELSFEEDLFQWEVGGYIILNNRYELFRKNPDATKEDPKNFYKYMGNGQDIISIKIVPKLYGPADNQNRTTPGIKELPFETWAIQFEGVIYDIEDMGGDGDNKRVKLMFVEALMYKLMANNIDFSTQEKATEGMSDEEIIKLDNYSRSLKIGDAIHSLLLKAGLEKNCANYGGELWNIGDDKCKIFYTSPTTHSGAQDLSLLNALHTSDEAHDFEPCLFMLERNKLPDTPKQFSIIPIRKYFEKAANMEYAIENFTLLNNIQHEKTNHISILKSPTINGPTNTVDVKAIEYSDISEYDFLENQALKSMSLFNNKFPMSFNNIDGQFNFEKKGLDSETIRKFIEEKYVSLLKTQDRKTRITLSKDIKMGKNSDIFYTMLPTKESRYAVGRNRAILSMMFSSMGISFSARGLTIRRPGRFISLSKRGEINEKDFDHRIEGQYLLTNVRHVFRADNSTYSTDLHGVKFHVYQEKFQPDEDAENSRL